MGARSSKLLTAAAVAVAVAGTCAPPAAQAVPIHKLPAALSKYLKGGKAGVDEAADALTKGVHHGDAAAAAYAKVLDDFKATTEIVDQSAAEFLVANLNHNRALYAKAGVQPPKYALVDLGAVLDNAAMELGRDALPMSTKANDLVRDLIILTRQIEVAKRLDTYASRPNPSLAKTGAAADDFSLDLDLDLDVGMLPPLPEVPRNTRKVLEAIVERRKRHEAVLGGMFADTNGFYLSLDEAKKLKPMFDALKLKRAPDSLPAEWRTKVGFAFRDVLDNGDKASSLSRAIVRRAELQGDHTFWGHVPPSGTARVAISDISPQEAERMMHEYRTTAHRDYKFIGNPAVSPYTAAYFH